MNQESAADALIAGPDRRRALTRPLVVAAGVHALLAVAQLVGAWETGSAGITSSAMHVAVGTAAHVVALVGIGLSTRPPDARHPYGYERFESLSTFVIGMLLLAAVALIVAVALPRLSEPAGVKEAGWGVALMVASAVANGALFLVLRSSGERLASQILRSESVHALADAGTALAVVVGLAAGSMGLLRLDPLIALAVGAAVAWRALAVIRTAAAALTDATPVDLDRLRTIAANVPGVRSCHAVRSRGAPGQALVDLHVHVDPELTVREAHAIALAVEAALVNQVGGVAEVLVHIGGQEPDDGGGTSTMSG